MTEQAELLVQREGHLCALVINRPEKRNFLVPEFLLKMADVIEDLAKEDSVRVLIIRGAGDEVFSAGYDISALPTTLSPDMEVSLKETPRLKRPSFRLETFPIP